MKGISFIILAICFISISKSELTTEFSIIYSQLIQDIYNFTQSSSVALVHFTSDFMSRQKNIILATQKLLREMNITVSDINLKILYNKTDEEIPDIQKLTKDKHVIRVYYVACNKDFIEMRNYMKSIRRSKVTNFLTFVECSDKKLLQICLNPKNNVLGLSKGVSILVKCCVQNPKIMEWYSFNETNMIVEERASWTPKTRLDTNSSKPFYDKLEVLKGKVLRAVTIRESEHIGDYFNNLISSLEYVGKFTIKKTKIEEDHGMYFENNKTWNGAINLTVENVVDIGLGWFTYLPQGHRFVDYTVTLSTAEFVILIKQPRTKVIISWSGYFEPFSSKVWGSLLLFFIVIQCIFIFIKRRLTANVHEESFAGNDFFYICQIFLNQALPNFPRERPLRIFYTTVTIFSFYVWTIYSASFVSKLTVVDSNIPFNSLEEFIEVKSHKLIVFQDSAIYYKLKNATKSSLYMKAAKLMVEDDALPKTNDDAIKKICTGNMALFVDDMFLPLAYKNNKSSICQITSIPIGEYDTFALILNKNSPYTAGINHFLRRFIENGILARLKSKIYKINSSNTSDYGSEHQKSSVILKDTIMLQTILCGGAIASIIALILEILYYFIIIKKEMLNTQHGFGLN